MRHTKPTPQHTHCLGFFPLPIFWGASTPPSEILCTAASNPLSDPPQTIDSNVEHCVDESDTATADQLSRWWYWCHSVGFVVAAYGVVQVAALWFLMVGRDGVISGGYSVLLLVVLVSLEGEGLLVW